MQASNISASYFGANYWLTYTATSTGNTYTTQYSYDQLIGLISETTIGQSTSGDQESIPLLSWDEIGSPGGKGLEKAGIATALATDFQDFAVHGAMVLGGAKSIKAAGGIGLKALTAAGTVIGMIAGGGPAVYNIVNNFSTGASQSWKDWASVGLAIIGGVSEFTGLGEAWDGTIGLGIATVSIGYDLYSIETDDDDDVNP